MLGTSSNVTPPSNFLLGERGVDTNDLFTSTGVRQRMPWGAGSWRLSWDTSRQTSNSPLTSFDPALQSGFQLAVSQPLLRDRKMDQAKQQTIVAKRNLESSELRVRESVVQTTAAVKQAYWTFKATLANVTSATAVARARRGAGASEHCSRGCGPDAASRSFAGRSRGRATPRKPHPGKVDGWRRGGPAAPADHGPGRRWVLESAP